MEIVGTLRAWKNRGDDGLATEDRDAVVNDAYKGVFGSTGGGRDAPESSNECVEVDEWRGEGAEP